MKVIVTLTMNPTIDTSSSITQCGGGSKAALSETYQEPGRGGINVSRAIRILGGRSIAIFTAGGAHGQLLQALLHKEDINLYPVPIKKITRTNFIILEKSSDRQFRFIMPGAGLDESEWSHCLQELSSVIPKPDYIIASGSLPSGVPEDFYAQVAVVATQWAPVSSWIPRVCHCAWRHRPGSTC
jgi:6-phosphofructokinase 2